MTLSAAADAPLAQAMAADLLRDPIVVTGLGAVTPLGVGIAANWQALLDGRSGIAVNDRFDVADYPCRIAGLVPAKESHPHGFDPLDHVEARDLRRMDLFILYSLAATEEALAQAAWRPEDAHARARTATVIGTGVGGLPAMTRAMRTVADKGPRRLSPFVTPSFLPNLAAGQISIRYGFAGPIGTPTTACAASAQAIADGVRLIQTGEADVAVCGGADACVDPIAIGGFCAAKALTTDFNDRPEAASRPFDRAHSGFVLSEGAATLVIERLSHAQARGATPLAILAGHGGSADAWHVTAGRPDGAGAAEAMRRALGMARLAPEAVDYVNAHSTSTPVGDAAELAAIASVFSGRGRDLTITSTKANTGHLLGAAGAIEAAFAVQALVTQRVPPAANLDDPMPEAAVFELNRPQAPRPPRPLDAVLSNAFGFGGVNAALLFRRAG